MSWNIPEQNKKQIEHLTFNAVHYRNIKPNTTRSIYAELNIYEAE